LIYLSGLGLSVKFPKNGRSNQ